MWHCDVYAQKKLLFHLSISQREWIYLKKIVSRATLMNWNIAMKCWNPKIIFSESIVIIQHALEKIQKTKRLSVNCKNMKIPLNERAKRTKKTEWPEGFLSGTMGDGSVRFRPLGKFFVNEILPRKFVPSVRTIQSVSIQKFCTPKEVQRFFLFTILFWYSLHWRFTENHYHIKNNLFWVL